MANMSNDYSRTQFAYSQGPASAARSPTGNSAQNPVTSAAAPQYSGSWQTYSTPPTYNYQQSTEYNAPPSPCPPGCNCGYDKNQQNYAGYSTAPPASEDRMDMNWGGNGTGYEPRRVSPVADSHIIKNPENPQPDESGKYPFHIIIQEIIRGLAGDQYAANADPSAFRTKLEAAETQRMSGLFFFNSFTQRDVNLQCTLLSQVIQYWSLEETTPDFSLQDDDYSSKSRSRSPKSPRSPREGSTKRKSRRGPPAPRYWSRLENAAVVGLMLGLPLDLLKVVLERKTNLNLGAVDAILDTNSAEALELLRTGGVNYSRGYSITAQYHAQHAANQQAQPTPQSPSSQPLQSYPQ